MEMPGNLIERLRRAERVAVLTGAGVSAESGVPTFRDAQTGFWANFKPEELATPEAFLAHPKRVWEWYAWRREKLAEVAPNPAHYALVALEAFFPHFTLITQNVDGLHERAGSREVICLHGNIARTKCFDAGHVVDDLTAVIAQEPEMRPPHCPECGSPLRPDVVWFGESLPFEAITEAYEAAAQCDVFLAIGTSGLVYPAADLPYHAQKSGATVIEINPEPTPLSEAADFLPRGKAGEILPDLVCALRSKR